MKNLDKIDEKIKKIISSNLFNKICFVLGIIIIAIYFGLYMLKTPIVDEEVRPEVTNNLIPWEVKGSDSFLVAMLTRPFNLNITELGQYRPRYLAFLVQFLDENIFLKLTRLISVWGNRQLFYIVAMGLTVLSIFYFIKNVWKNCPKGLNLFISSSILMFQNYQITTYWRARSAKLLALSACVFLITYIIKNLEVELKKNGVKKILISIPIFLLMTLDEQVLAIGALLFGLSVLFSIINKKINLSTVIMTISCFLYGTFHLWWGKALFKHFTGSLQKHGHTIGGSLKGISLKTIKEACEILKSTIPKVIFMSFAIFVILWLVSFTKMLLDKEISKKSKIKNGLISLFLASSSIILLMLMIDAHSAIYTIPVLWKSVYPLIATIILFLSLIYLLGNVQFKYDSIKYILVIVGVCISLCYNFINVNSYYGAYLSEKGGFMGEYTDLIVTKDKIKTEAVNSKDMDIDNENFIAVLNTPFSTTNYKTTRVLYGKYNNNYIKKNYSCYLVVKENRKLYLKVTVDNYKKFDSVDIIINNSKIKTIKINENEIEEQFYITTEVNRACKVTLNFKTKQDIDKKSIKLEKLYMK